jgi:hypothetical protein
LHNPTCFQEGQMREQETCLESQMALTTKSVLNERVRPSIIGGITHFEDVVVPTLHESIVLYVFHNNIICFREQF